MGTQHLIFYGQKIFVCALCLFKSLLWILNFSDFKNGTNHHTSFFVEILFCNFCWQKPRASLLKNSLLLLVYAFFSFFIDSSSFCGGNDTDIGRGSSVAASRLIPFLVSSSFLAFIDFSSFFTTVFFSFFFVFFVSFL